MILGFTGTRYGTTEQQRARIIHFLTTQRLIDTAHHGDCIGADAEFRALLDTYGNRSTQVIVHPGDIPHLRAHCERPGDLILPPKPPLERNHDIVDACTVLLACPRIQHEVLRSGTWATLRYAQAAGKEIWRFLPDGTIESENVHA